jgi:hypothetical protein
MSRVLTYLVHPSNEPGATKPSAGHRRRSRAALRLPWAIFDPSLREEIPSSTDLEAERNQPMQRKSTHAIALGIWARDGLKAICLR